MIDFSNLSKKLKNEYEAKSTDSVDVFVDGEESLEVLVNKNVKSIPLFCQETNKSLAVGLDYKSLLQELLKPLHWAMMRVGVSSISTEVLGTFLNSFPLNASWYKEELFDTGKFFYVLKNQSREVYIYDTIRQACEQTQDEIVTIPAVVPCTLLVQDKGLELELKTHSLMFTRKELNYIRFAFIKKIDLSYDDLSHDPYFNAAYVITVDRSKLEAAPYEVGQLSNETLD